MLTIQTCKSLGSCFLKLWGKHVVQSINIYYLGKAISALDSKIVQAGLTDKL